MMHHLISGKRASLASSMLFEPMQTKLNKCQLQTPKVPRIPKPVSLFGTELSSACQGEVKTIVWSRKKLLWSAGVYYDFPINNVINSPTKSKVSLNSRQGFSMAVIERCFLKIINSAGIDAALSMRLRWAIAGWSCLSKALLFCLNRRQLMAAAP